MFGETTSKDLVIELLEMDLDQTENAQIKELINCSESVSYTDDEIESSIFLMIKKMKKNESPVKTSEEPVVEQKRVVEIEFRHGKGNFLWRTLAIDTDKTTEELTEIMTKINNGTPFAYFKFNGTVVEEDLRKYNLKDGDVLHYWLRKMANN